MAAKMSLLNVGIAWQRWVNRVRALNQPHQAAQKRAEAIRCCNIVLAAP